MCNTSNHLMQLVYRIVFVSKFQCNVPKMTVRTFNVINSRKFWVFLTVNSPYAARRGGAGFSTRAAHDWLNVSHVRGHGTKTCVTFRLTEPKQRLLTLTRFMKTKDTKIRSNEAEYRHKLHEGRPREDSSKVRYRLLYVLVSSRATKRDNTDLCKRWTALCCGCVSVWERPYVTDTFC